MLSCYYANDHARICDCILASLFAFGQSLLFDFMLTSMHTFALTPLHACTLCACTPLCLHSVTLEHLHASTPLGLHTSVLVHNQACTPSCSHSIYVRTSSKLVHTCVLAHMFMLPHALILEHTIMLVHQCACVLLKLHAYVPGPYYDRMLSSLCCLGLTCRFACVLLRLCANIVDLMLVAIYASTLSCLSPFMPACHCLCAPLCMCHLCPCVLLSL